MSGSNQIPVIVLGSGVTALGVCRALGRAGIPNYLVNPDRDFSIRSRWVRMIDRPVQESSEPTALERFLRELDFERAVLMPCSDRWSNAVAGLGAALHDRFPASMSSGSAVGILTDKGRLRAALERLGIPMPRTVPIRSLDDFAAVPDDELPGYFLKPRDSQGFSQTFRRKAFPVAGRADATARWAEMRAAGFEAVLQEYVVGPPAAHYFIDGFVDRLGEVKAIFARQRLFMFPVDFGNSTLMVSVAPDEVAAAVTSLRTLLSDLAYRGIFSAEFKRDERDGLFKLLEVNVRPWWFVEFAALSGVDVCTMAYRDALGIPVPAVDSYDIGARHMIFLQHLRAFVATREERGTTLREWLGGSRGARDAVFRWGDPMPGLAMTMDYARKALARPVPSASPAHI